jgi:hypothetical protein
MEQSSDPFDQANEADVAEQSTPVRDPWPDRPEVLDDEANEADVLEQRSFPDDPAVSHDEANEADALDQVADVSDDDDDDYLREEE